MSFIKNAQFLGGVLKARYTKTYAPLHVSLTITNRCNMRCIYCYGAYYERDLSDTPLSVWIKAVDDIADMGGRCVHLGGGEPLMREDVGEIIDHVKSRGLMCRMNSNGTLIPKMIDKIKNLDSICVSLDGVGEDNDRNRGQGTFTRIVEGLKTAQRAGMSTHISAVITRNSFKNVEKLLGLAKELGVRVEFGLPYEVSTSSRERSEMKFTDEEMRDILRKLIALRRQGLPVFYSQASHQYALDWPVNYATKILQEEELPKGFKHLECYMGRTQCFVDGDGSVYPCGQLIGRFPAKNMFETGFKEAWNNLFEHKLCKTCYCMCFLEYNHVFNLTPSVLGSNIARETGNAVKAALGPAVRRLLGS